MGKRSVPEEQIEVLRAGLTEVALAGDWDPQGAARLVDVALRRWSSFERRSRPNKRGPQLRLQDLQRGLQEHLADDSIYLEPGWLEHVAQRFGQYLLAAAPPAP